MMRLLLAAALPLLLLAGRAEAHAVLTGSTPAASASVPAGDVAVTLHYNSKIDRGRSRVTVTEPGAKEPVVLAIAQESAPDVIQTSVKQAKPGAYVLHWQVLATDGHITRGDLPFSVK
jgi:copper resistance protein C